MPQTDQNPSKWCCALLPCILHAQYACRPQAVLPQLHLIALEVVLVFHCKVMKNLWSMQELWLTDINFFPQTDLKHTEYFKTLFSKISIPLSKLRLVKHDLQVEIAQYQRIFSDKTSLVCKMGESYNATKLFWCLFLFLNPHHLQFQLIKNVQVLLYLYCYHKRQYHVNIK